MYEVPSSSGLGHHPLTVETRVRLPLGLPEKQTIKEFCVTINVETNVKQIELSVYERLKG